MNRKHVLTSAVLWATAIVAAAAASAPDFLFLILLPCLATTSLLMTRQGACLEGPLINSEIPRAMDGATCRQVQDGLVQTFLK